MSVLISSTGCPNSDSTYEWVKARLREMAEEAQSFNEWALTRRAELEQFSGRVYAWGDEHVAKVTAEQEERARLHHRDVDIVTSTQALLERHGVPLPPPKPAEQANPVEEADAEHAAVGLAADVHP